MPKIKPFRTVNEYDVYNLYKWNPTGTYPAEKGTLVKIISGWNNDQNLAELGPVGASYTNTVSQRYGILPYVAACTASGDKCFGMLLYDVKETDENGMKLLFDPQKQAQMQCVLSGQAVPIVTKGMFLYSGINGTPVAGASAYVGSDGNLSADGNTSSTVVGKFLGTKDPDGWALIKLEL